MKNKNTTDQNLWGAAQAVTALNDDYIRKTLVLSPKFLSQDTRKRTK